MKCVCDRCLTESSVFWYPIGLGCGEDGDGAYRVIHLCDNCMFDLAKFMEPNKGQGVKE